jgi:hypothetical protein
MNSTVAEFPKNLIEDVKFNLNLGSTEFLCQKFQPLCCVVPATSTSSITVVSDYKFCVTPCN